MATWLVINCTKSKLENRNIRNTIRLLIEGTVISSTFTPNYKKIMEVALSLNSLKKIFGLHLTWKPMRIKLPEKTVSRDI